MVRLSIIIPLLGDDKRLDDTLVSVLENRPHNCEIIVVHNGPYDDPYHLADEVRFVEAQRATKSECLNRGLAAARAHIVHFLACGVEATPGWADAAVRRLGDAQVAAVAPVVLSAGAPDRILSAGLAYGAEGCGWRIGRGMNPLELGKCRIGLRGPDLSAAFYCHSALEAAGGFSDLASDALMGIDAAMKLRRLGFRCELAPDSVVRADPALDGETPGFRHGRDAERLFWRWASELGWGRSLLGHAALTIGECALGLRRPAFYAQLAGRVWGAVQAAVAGRKAGRIAPFSARPTPALDAIPSPPAAAKRRLPRAA